MMAKVYYKGSLQSLQHKCPSGNKYTFVGPNVPVEISNEDDIALYSRKASFEVVIDESELVEEIIDKTELSSEFEEGVLEPSEISQKSRKSTSKLHKKTRGE